MNIKIKPLVTEKTLKDVKLGKYTFKAGFHDTKDQIKHAIKQIFGVNVVSIRTSKYKGEVRRNVYRKVVGSGQYKKAIVTLKKDEKIDIFTEK